MRALKLRSAIAISLLEVFSLGCDKVQRYALLVNLTSVVFTFIFSPVEMYSGT
jgi:hypothetical protein